jgi:3-methyladenine DNA glycosylase AlkD
MTCSIVKMYLLIKLNSLQKESLKSIEPLLNDHDGSTHKSNGWLFHHFQKRDVNKTNDTKCNTIKKDPKTLSIQVSSVRV